MGRELIRHWRSTFGATVIAATKICPLLYLRWVATTLAILADRAELEEPVCGKANCSR
jgi:hypothetical protein